MDWDKSKSSKKPQDVQMIQPPSREFGERGQQPHPSHNRINFSGGSAASLSPSLQARSLLLRRLVVPLRRASLVQSHRSVGQTDCLPDPPDDSCMRIAEGRDRGCGRFGGRRVVRPFVPVPH